MRALCLVLCALLFGGAAFAQGVAERLQGNLLELYIVSDPLNTFSLHVEPDGQLTLALEGEVIPGRWWIDPLGGFCIQEMTTGANGQLRPTGLDECFGVKIYPGGVTLLSQGPFRDGTVLRGTMSPLR